MADLYFTVKTDLSVPQVHLASLPGLSDTCGIASLWRQGPREWEQVPCQVDTAGSKPRLCWVSEGNPDREVQYRFFVSAPSQAPQKLGVGFAVQDCRYRFKVRWNGAIVGAYNFIGQREAGLEAGALPTIVDPRVNLAWVGFKPFWYPLYTPAGLRLTENSPADHPHHHSVWFGHAKVNGIDCWIETGAVGKILLREIRDVVAGPVFAGWTETNWWVGPDGTKLFEEDRSHRLWHLGQGYLLDMALTFRATEGSVHFEKEKDAGLGIRVADSLDVEDGGLILNSHGDRNEAGTFNRLADWLDYSGPVSGRTGGLAVFNGPDVPIHPWFSRDYGPLLSNFMRFRSYLLPQGEQLCVSFRLYLHDGDANAARVAEHYAAFKMPPRVEMEARR